MNMKKGFTLIELLAVLIIIGVIAVMLIANVMKATPHRNKAMFKKAYNIVEKTTEELINDETLYPYDPEYPGFLNNEVVEIPLAIDPKAGIRQTTTGNDLKFCELFASKLNISETDKTCSFTTSDGIYWNISNKTDDFNIKGYKKITVDVNGKDKGPNDLHAQDKARDTFEVLVYSDGKVGLGDDARLEKIFLQSQSPRAED